MSVIRKSELKALDSDSLKKKLSEIEAEIRVQYSEIKTGRRQKSLKYKELRRVRARIKTFLKQRGIAL